jgi:hypothetical protein
MTTVLVLEPVGPFAFEDDPYRVSYRACDFCHDSAIEDIWAGRILEEEWRAFYRLRPGGEVCCEHCLPDVLAGG